MSIYDDALEEGASIDWMGPVYIGVRNILEPSETFAFYGGMNGVDVQALFRRNKIRHWGLQHVGSDTVLIEVARDDAAKACQVLDGVNLPYETTVKEPPARKRQPQRGRSEPRQGQAGSPFEVFSIFD